MRGANATLADTLQRRILSGRGGPRPRAIPFICLATKRQQMFRRAKLRNAPILNSAPLGGPRDKKAVSEIIRMKTTETMDILNPAVGDGVFTLQRQMPPFV